MLIVAPLTMAAQNIIQNPSFETNSGLPTGPGQYNRATGWSNANSSSASPDYLHTGGSGGAQLPNSVFGTLSPYQGNAVMGMALYYPTTPNFREYVSQHLSAPLIVGNSYTFSFYISNAVTSTYGGMGIRNVQVDFSVNPINQVGSTPLGYTPMFTPSGIVYSNGWIPVTFTFTAAAPYAYFAIGNFMNDANTVGQSQSFSAAPNQLAYYYIDQVSLVVNNNTPVAITGTQNICQGNSTVLTGSGATTYTWLPGNITTSTISVSPSATTTYTLLGGPGTSSAVATVTVNALPNVTASAAGTLNCVANTVGLNSNLSSGHTYTWTGPGFSGGVNGQNAMATAAGIYTIAVTNTATGCTNTSTTAVTQNTVVPVVTASTNGTLTCITNTVDLSSSLSSGVTYTWTGPGFSGGVNGQNAVGTSVGIYTVTVTGTTNGCTSIATTTVTQNTTTLSVTASSTGTLTCSTNTVNLSSSLSSGVTYTWSGPGFSGAVNGQNAVATAIGIYTITVTNTVNGCNSIATTTVAQNMPLPLLTASAGTLTCSATTLTLNGTSSPSAGVTSLWSGPGIVSGAATFSPVVNLPGTYSMTATDTVNGCSATITTTVLQNTVAPVIGINLAPVCGTPTVQLSATSSVNTVTYAWTAPASGTLTTYAISNPVASGTGVFTVVVTNTVNGCSTSETTTVSILTNTLVISANSATICSGSSATITATSNAASFSWNPAGSLSAASGSVVVASPNATSVYTVTGATGGCTVAAEFTVHVIATPTISISSSTTTICEGSTTALTASGATAYTWSPAGSLSSSSTAIVNASPTVTTTYSVAASNGTAPDVCVAGQSVLITVIPKTSGAISYSAEICAGGYTTLSTLGGNTVKWLPPTGLANSTSPVTKASPSVSTTYTAIISNNGSCPDVKTVDVVVHPVPLVDAGRDTTIAYGDSLTLMGTGEGVLAWISGEFLNCNHCRNPYIIPEENSCYVIQAISDKGCASFDEMCVNVNKESAVYIPNTFTPNGDGVNDVFTISGFGIREMELLIFNRWGTLIYTTNDINKGWDGKNKGATCENGVYVYKVTYNTITKETEERVGHVTLIGK